MSNSNAQSSETVEIFNANFVIEEEENSEIVNQNQSYKPSTFKTSLAMRSRRNNQQRYINPQVKSRSSVLNTFYPTSAKTRRSTNKITFKKPLRPETIFESTREKNIVKKNSLVSFEIFNYRITQQGILLQTVLLLQTQAKRELQ